MARSILTAITTLVVGVYASSCGSDDSSSDSCSSAPAYATISATVTESCALSSCHVSGTDRADLTVEANLKTNSVSAAARIRSNDMPRAPGALSDATKKANLLSWLDCNKPQ